ncbi:DUF418 domain-containing protein [Kribbella sp. NPDC051770]|uniref:DUF418 domain-containing protein n=1 Tax=Kribbella sp. NPDC051770 TaxID=3155413 RepID=UPI003442F99C
MAHTATPPAVEHRGPVTRRERALAPDLIRGAMLLLIALANAANFGFAGAPGVNGTPHGLERVFNLLKLTLVDARAYPVFGLMFGYGLVQLARRQQNSGSSVGAVRSILLKRHLWMVGFGLVHATLLYFGDFLGAYGLIGVLCTLLLLNRSDKFHRLIIVIWALQVLYAVGTGVLALMAALNSTGPAASITNSPNPSLAATSYGQSLVERLQEYPAHTAFVLGLIVVVWLGMWAARRQILENPAQHKTLLTRVAVLGLSITVLGGLPLGLVGAGWLHVDSSAVSSFEFLAQISGQFGGPGYVALFGLIVAKLLRRPQLGRPLTAISALGQRSLSGYLFQSVAWTILLAPYGLNLDLGNTAFTAAAAAIAIWIVSVLAANAMQHRNYRGPAETLLRRLVYNR